MNFCRCPSEEMDFGLSKTYVILLMGGVFSATGFPLSFCVSAALQFRVCRRHGVAELAGVVLSLGMMFNMQSLYLCVKARDWHDPLKVAIVQRAEATWKRREVPERRNVPEVYCFVLTSVSFRGESATMLTSTAQVFFSLRSGCSWLPIFAIAKDFLGVSRVSTSVVETLDVP